MHSKTSSNLSNKPVSSFSKSALKPQELLEFPKIEPFLTSNLKTTLFLSQISLENDSLNFESKLSNLNQEINSIKDNPLKSETSSLTLTCLYLSAVSCYLKLNQLELSEKCLENAKLEIKIEKTWKNPESQMIYLKILAFYLTLRFAQKSIDGLIEVKELIIDFIENQNVIIIDLSILDWISGAIFGTIQDLTKNSLNPKMEELRKFFTGIYQEFLGEKNPVREIYSQFLGFAQSEDLNELVLICLKRMKQLEKENENLKLKLQNFYDGKVKIFTENKPDFTKNFQIFEKLFNVIVEISCFLQMNRNQITSIPNNIKNSPNFELIKLVIKFMLRRFMVKIKKTNSGFYEELLPSNEAENSIKQKPDFSKKTSNSLNSIVNKSNIQEKKQIETNNVDPKLQEPWIHFAPLRELLSGVKHSNIPSGVKNKDSSSSIKQIFPEEISETILQTIKKIEDENSELILNSLSNLPIFISSLNEFQKYVQVLADKCKSILLSACFWLIKQKTRSKEPTAHPLDQNAQRNLKISNQDQFQAQSLDLSRSKKPNKSNELNQSQIFKLFKKFLTIPEEIIKLNYSTTGKSKKYFIIINRNLLRVADKSEYLLNPKLCKSIPLSAIRGITYGKVTHTFFKKGNKNLEAWLCFSIILPHKSIDLYASETKLNLWIYTLSEMVKASNHTAYCLRKGQLLWRKMRFLVEYLVYQQIQESKKKKFRKSLSFPQAWVLYRVYLQKHAKSSGVKTIG